MFTLIQRLPYIASSAISFSNSAFKCASFGSVRSRSAIVSNVFCFLPRPRTLRSFRGALNGFAVLEAATYNPSLYQKRVYWYYAHCLRRERKRSEKPLPKSYFSPSCAGVEDNAIVSWSSVVVLIVSVIALSSLCIYFCRSVFQHRAACSFGGSFVYVVYCRLWGVLSDFLSKHTLITRSLSAFSAPLCLPLCGVLVLRSSSSSIMNIKALSALSIRACIISARSAYLNAFKKGRYGSLRQV